MIACLKRLRLPLCLVKRLRFAVAQICNLLPLPRWCALARHGYCRVGFGTGAWAIVSRLVQLDFLIGAGLALTRQRRGVRQSSAAFERRAPSKAAEDCRTPKPGGYSHGSMDRLAHSLAVAWLMILATGGVSATGQAAAPIGNRVLAAWEFNQAGNLQGWQPNGHLTEVKVADGALSCRAVGSDPILELRPLIDLTASPWQFLEVRLKASRDGTAEFFWSNTSTGRYGGFSQEKTTRFNVTGDGQWHTYRLMPFWQAEKKIVRLRFDVFDGARFDVDYFRILQQDMPRVVDRADFDFADSAQNWQALEGASLDAGSQGVSISTSTAEGFVFAPPVRLWADEENFVSLRLAVDRGSRATLFFATAEQSSLKSLTFPIKAGAGERTYNLDMLAAPGWKGHVIALGLRPSDADGATGRLRWLKVSDAPQGAPQLQVKSFVLADALPRAGRSATLAAIVSNTGGIMATNIQARLELPSGLKLSDNDADAKSIAALGFGDEVPLNWRVMAAAPLTNTVRLSLSSPNAEAVETTASVDFLPALKIEPAEYVPECKPVRGPYEVGVYYFPGWKTASQWRPSGGSRNANRCWAGIAKGIRKWPIGTSNGRSSTASRSLPTTGTGTRARDSLSTRCTTVTSTRATGTCSSFACSGPITIRPALRRERIVWR